MNKILTIVVPTYNMEALLPRCLDSLVKPNSSDLLEVLVVNDGSTDNSLKIARKYEKKYPKVIKVLDKTNGNYGSAINKGIELANGKYFRILDSDDFYNNSDLIKFVDLLNGIEADLILTNYRQNKGLANKSFCAPTNVYGKLFDFESVNISDYPNFSMHGITYNTKILKDNQIRLSTGISYTDSEFCFYPLPYVKTLLALNLCVYSYQLGREGQTVDLKSQIRCIPHMIVIIEKMHDSIVRKSTGTRFYYNQLCVFCGVVNLCLSTILCYDRNCLYLSELSYIINLINEVKGANEILMKKNMFGVKYYKRYVLCGKTSSSFLYLLYYTLVRIISRFVCSLISIFK